MFGRKISDCSEPIVPKIPKNYILYGITVSKCVMTNNNTHFFLRKGCEGYTFLVNELNNKGIGFEEKLLVKTSSTNEIVCLSFSTTSRFPVDQLDLYSPDAIVKLNKEEERRTYSYEKTKHEKKENSGLLDVTTSQQTYNVYQSVNKYLNVEDFLQTTGIVDRIEFIEGMCYGDMLEKEEKINLICKTGLTTKTLYGTNAAKSENVQQLIQKETDTDVRNVHDFFSQEFVSVGQKHWGKIPNHGDRRRHLLVFKDKKMFVRIAQIISTICVRYRGYHIANASSGKDIKKYPCVTGNFQLRLGKKKNIYAVAHSPSKPHELETLSEECYIYIVSLTWIDVDHLNVEEE